MSPTAGYFFVILTCGFEVCVALKALNERIIRFLLFFCVGLIYGLVPFIGPTYEIGNYYHPTQNALRRAPWIILFGTILMAAAWHIVDHASEGRQEPPTPLCSLTTNRRFQRAAWRITLVSAVIGIVGMLLNFRISGGSIGAFVGSSRFQYRNGSGSGFGAVITLQLLVFAFVPPFMTAILKKRLQRWACFLYTLGFASFYFVATSGTRSIPLGLIGSLVLGWVLTRRPKMSTAVFATFAMLIGAFASVGLYAVRKDVRRQSLFTTTRALFSTRTYRNAVNTDPLNYNGEFLAAIDDFPSQHPNLDGATYIRILLFPLPNTVTFGLKPPDTHVTFGNTVVPGSDASIPPSIPGDGWINFWGAPGAVAIMAFWGAVGAYIDSLLRRRAWWLFWLGPELARMMALFVRGQPYETVVLAVEIWLGMTVVARLCGLPPIWRLDRRPAARVPRRRAIPRRRDLQLRVGAPELVRTEYDAPATGRPPDPE